MKIFDGVEVNPAKLSPTWQGVIGAAMIFGNVLMEADKIRCEREAKEPADPSAGSTTLADVMEQSGLKIPHLQGALTAFMGGTDEAKEVAAMIIDLPDPAKLLREFTRQYRRQTTPTTAANGPIVTPPPATAAPAAEPAGPTPATAAASSPPKLATFRHEFTPEGLAAAEAARKTPDGPRPKLATFRPEFTPEGLAAPTAAAAPRPKLATFRPEFTPEGLAAAGQTAKPAIPSAPTSAPASGVASQLSEPKTPADAGRSLADAMVDRLESLARQRAAHEADLDTRMRCAEAELAMLREELLTLRMQGERPILFVVPPPDDVVAPTGAFTPESDEASDAAIPTIGEIVAVRSEEHPPPDEATSASVPNAVDVDSPPSVEANKSAVEVAVVAEASDEPRAYASVGDVALEQARSTDADANADEAVVDVEAVSPGGEQAPLPAPSSDTDLARALALVDKFSEEQQASYARDSERMRSLERMISTLRGQVEGERSRRSGGGHG